MSHSSHLLLQRMERNTLDQGLVMPTKLFAYNDSVDQYNTHALEQIPSQDVEEYHAFDEGSDVYLRQLQKNCQAPALLVLKPGAQVMLLKNLNVVTGLVNGSRGVVDSFIKDPEVFIKLFVYA